MTWHVQIAHFSDTHGLPRKRVPDSASIIVHTGDLFPNKTRGHRDIEPAYQREWLIKTISDWKAWIGGRPFVYVSGNHDFFDPIEIMKRAGIDAYGVSHRELTKIWLASSMTNNGKLVDERFITFAGIPDIPWMGSEWNHERHEAEISARFAEVLALESDVIACHCPMYGVLDVAYGNHIGSTSIATAMLYGEHEPLAYLHGHCHEAHGEARIRNTLVSNAATVRRAVNLEISAR